MHRGPVSAQARKDFKHHSIEIAITSECNLNLLEQAKYFLKLIAIFVDFARHFGGGVGTAQAGNWLLGSVVYKIYIFSPNEKSIFTNYGYRQWNQ